MNYSNTPGTMIDIMQTSDSSKAVTPKKHLTDLMYLFLCSSEADVTD